LLVPAGELGSCGVRINDKPGMACHSQLQRAAQAGPEGSRVITVEPMGNMPAIRHLIVDVDAVHWKKIQRVTPWLINKESAPARGPDRSPAAALRAQPVRQRLPAAQGRSSEHNQELADTLNARTFALAQQTDGELMLNICSTCHGRRSSASSASTPTSPTASRSAASLQSEGLSYQPALTNKNFLWLLVEEIGLPAVQAKVVRPLAGLRAGPFYGCYVVRPMDQLRIDDDHPRHRYLHWVIEAPGGTVVDSAGVYSAAAFRSSR